MRLKAGMTFILFDQHSQEEQQMLCSKPSISQTCELLGTVLQIESGFYRTALAQTSIRENSVLRTSRQVFAKEKF